MTRLATSSFLLLLALWSPPAAAAEPMLEKINLFEARQGGYELYRVPGIVVTPQGTVLAYCEARKSRHGDWGTIDILLRRSTDGGRTWGQPQRIVKVKGSVEQNPVAVQQKLARPGEITQNNACAIVDREKRLVHFLYCLEYARCYYMVSQDDGQTFSEAVDITPTFEKFRADYDWKVLATGPGHGIQLDNGRLVVPVWLSTGTGGHAHRPSAVSVIYSDDHGKTWERGEIVVAHPDLKNPSETVIVQLADGRVMLNIRNENPEHRRAVSYSKNGATGWSKPKFHPQLWEPICMGSIVRLSQKPESDRNRILFANPHSNEPFRKNRPAGNHKRQNVTVKLSYDEGETWPVARPLEPGLSGYTDLAVGPDGTMFCVYECGAGVGNHYQLKYLTVARFNLQWLTQGKDRLQE